LIDGVLQLDLPRGAALARSSHTLPAFVVGPENSLAVPPLERLLNSAELAELTSLFNPLLLVGPSGSGKTQLAQALTRRWREVLQHSTESPGIEYITAADFGREAQAAAAEHRLPAWQKHIRSLRVLLLEDLQNLRPRDTIQQELRHAIDAILEAGGLIVITSNRDPATLSHLDPGLRDRLAGGLTLHLQRPNLAAREAILRLAANSRGLTLTENQLRELAHREAASANDLLGRLNSLPLVGMGPNEHGRPEVARAQCGSLCAATGEGVEAPARFATQTPQSHQHRIQSHHALKQILAVTARYFGVTQAALTGPSRRTSLVAARNIVVHLARRLTDLSYADIGRALGNRDHTTIMHADRRLAEQLATDPHTQQTIDELDHLLC
jgi:chromosomal replication initiator protein